MDARHPSINESEDTWFHRRGECDRAKQDLEEDYERKKQESAAVEEGNDDDSYNAD